MIRGVRRGRHRAAPSLSQELPRNSFCRRGSSTKRSRVVSERRECDAGTSSRGAGSPGKLRGRQLQAWYSSGSCAASSLAAVLVDVDERHGASGLVGEHPVRVDLFLVDQAVAVEGPGHERRVHQVDRRERLGATTLVHRLGLEGG
jgi:hypothetical protein